MEPPIFFATPAQFAHDSIEITGAEAHHAAKALRLGPGSIVMVIDGLGNASVGEITNLMGKKVFVRPHSRVRNFGEPVVRLTLAAALSTSGKFSEVVEKGTELGVSRFVPILSQKSKVHIEDPRKAQAKVARLEKVALAAVKQCRRSCLPVISLPTTLEHYLVETGEESVKLIFSPGPISVPLTKVEIDRNAKRVSVMVGPESGFTREEMELSLSHGFVPVSLGARILRTENASPVVCALVMQMLGELS